MVYCFVTYSIPLHVVDINVSVGQGIRFLHNGLLRAGDTVGDDFMGVVLDVAKRSARSSRNR